MIAIVGGGGITALMPHILEHYRTRGQQNIEVAGLRLGDNAQFRQDLMSQVSELNGRVDTLRGQVDEWQKLYFQVTTQNEILKSQVETMKAQNLALQVQNEELKKMVAALEDENEALQKKMNET